MRVLILNQCFYPDVAATGQYATDLARKLAERGHEVTVLVSRRKYDDPTVSFRRIEHWRGIRIERLTTTGFGKGARWRRALDFSSFYVACILKLAKQERFDIVIAMTSPPLISCLAAWFIKRKGGHLYLWMMDLNPDQAIAAGWLGDRSLLARALKACLMYATRHATRIVVLDRFMMERLTQKGIPAKKVFTVPLWTLDQAVSHDPGGRAVFLKQHRLEEKFVVMYSGNHSPCHPLDTLLGAAARLAGRNDIAFCFVGGGSEFGKVKRFARDRSLGNVLCLPYQPLDRLSASLSAADLHVVAMGDPFVGIVHPCKIYNILRLGIPVLYVGPQQSHVVDLLTESSEGLWGFMARHGDVDLVVRHILHAAAIGSRRYTAATELAKRFSERILLQSMVSLIESGTDSPSTSGSLFENATTSPAEPVAVSRPQAQTLPPTQHAETGQ